MIRVKSNGRLNLRAGELVEVRSAEEILATLDEHGRLDNMPFMPEMLQFCGRRLRVGKRAHKTCDTISKGSWGLIRLENTVHLDDLRCGGEAHGGCQAECLFFWKEAWLKRVPASGNRVPAAAASSAPSQRCTLQKLNDLTRVAGTEHDADGPTYSCQATQLLNSGAPLKWWDPRQYVTDVWSGNVSLSAVVKGLAIQVFNRVQALRKGRRIPHVAGTLKKTPKHELGLAPGELVRIKTKDEVLATLDVNEKNRGLLFDAEMVKFCGGQFRVHNRVEKILSERTGKMIRLPGDCIVLEGVVCESDYHMFCPRAIYPYWREIWLSRIEDHAATGKEQAAESVAVSSAGSL